MKGHLTRNILNRTSNLMDLEGWVILMAVTGQLNPTCNMGLPGAWPRSSMPWWLDLPEDWLRQLWSNATSHWQESSPGAIPWHLIWVFYFGRCRPSSLLALRGGWVQPISVSAWGSGPHRNSNVTSQPILSLVSSDPHPLLQLLHSVP